ncbi:hypothetical protein ACFQ07_33715 [Actinomadura adrarensis]|uniref:Uncharacterized protein n=1 Tax=Actinomadura adrarensis TaxID=1819600 RepID=A0ABW3CRM4_9ACTN
MVPYGLRHQVRLDEAYTAPISGIVYDPNRQLSTVGGRPLVEQPALLRQYTVTWGTTANDNKTDDGG